MPLVKGKCCKSKEQKPEEKAKKTKKNTAKEEAKLEYRDAIKPSDVERVREIIQSSNFFNPEEVDIAVELIQDRVTKGEKSEYEFLFIEENQKTIGYSCFGRILGTQASYDLYWIAVDNDYRAKGIGKQLLQKTEEIMEKAGGYKIYVETSSQEKYTPTRHFYLKSNYILEGCLKDFYGPSDDKHIYTKIVGKTNKV